MSEVEYGGVKLTGSKLFMIIPLVSMLGGGLWAGFEFYKDYMDMKEQIQNYVAPDLSEFDKKLAVFNEDMKVVTEKVDIFKEEIIIIRDSVNESVDMMRDTKHDLRDEIIRTEKLLEKVENDIDKLEDEATALMDRTKDDTRSMIDDANNRFNDKVSGLEGFVKRELGALEDDLNKKLQKSLDNPLANRNN